MGNDTSRMFYGSGSLPGAELQTPIGVALPPPPCKYESRTVSRTVGGSTEPKMVTLVKINDESVGIATGSGKHPKILNVAHTGLAHGKLRVGDYILSINGKEIVGGQDQVFKLLNSVKRGDLEVLVAPDARNTVLVEEEGQISIPDVSQMLTSTLQTPPGGYQILHSKPIIWGSSAVSQGGVHTSAFFFGESGAVFGNAGEHDPSADATQVGTLLASAQQTLLEKAHGLGCNAVLGVTISITNDSMQFGERGEKIRKTIIATALGTPCIVAPIDAYASADAQTGAPPPVYGSVVTPAKVVS